MGPTEPSATSSEIPVEKFIQEIVHVSMLALWVASLVEKLIVLTLHVANKFSFHFVHHSKWVSCEHGGQATRSQIEKWIAMAFKGCMMVLAGNWVEITSSLKVRLR